MLTERQKLILLALIDEYIASAEPVGSRTVSKNKNIGFSAATIRNEMADLEEMGYLEQPHTSAGRIPSQSAYRLYVDHLLSPYSWISEIMAFEEAPRLAEMDNLEETIRKTASFLAKQTNYMAISLGPKSYEHNLRHLQVVTLSDRVAVSILVTDTGGVFQQKFMLPPDLTVYELERIVNLINENLTGYPLSTLRRAAYHTIFEAIQSIAENPFDIHELLTHLLHIQNTEQVYTSGTTRMLEQPEFQDFSKMKVLVDLLEETQTMMQLIQPTSEGVQVRIGKENLLASVSHCSVISASIIVDGEHIGTVGVLGPTRMDYRKVIGLITYLSGDVYTNP